MKRTYVSAKFAPWRAVAMGENGDLGAAVPDYVDENVSTKVVKIIQSYTGIVNRMVWRKT
jgi:UDP-N-acetylglucosamine 2-epimerase (non-hydrolysing)